MKLLVITFLFFIAGAVFSQDTIFKKFYYPDGTISSMGTLIDGKPDGYWKNFYPNAVLKSEGRRTNLQLDSVWNFYDESGLLINSVSYLLGNKNGYNEIYEIIEKDGIKKTVLIRKELYINNLKNGNTLEYNYEGDLIKETPYVKGKKEGIGFEYSSTGIKIGLFVYQDNKLLKYERINRTNEAGNKEGVWKDFHSNGTVKYERNYLNNRLHGIAKIYNYQGEIQKILKYQNDEQIDEKQYILEFEEPEEKIEYYSNGKIKWRGTYRKNIPIGIHRYYNEQEIITAAKTYSENGILLSEGIVFDDGNKHGTWVNLYSNGKVSSKGTYRNNKKEGIWSYYFENGKLKQEGSFKNDLFSGIWTWYFINGQTRKTEEFFMGKKEGLSVEYNEVGNILSEGMYIDDLKDGNWFELVGDNIEKGEYKLGAKHGLWIHEYTSGKIRFEGNYSIGKPKGKHIYYFESGIKEHIEIYRNGKKHKNWIYYNTDGSPKLMIFYKNGKEIKIVSF